MECLLPKHKAFHSVFRRWRQRLQPLLNPSIQATADWETNGPKELSKQLRSLTISFNLGIVPTRNPIC